MKTINRRSFLEKATIGFGGALALSTLPKNLLAAAVAVKTPLGFQTYPIREMLEKDFAGTLKMMAAQGYQLTEMCSPKGYVNAGFGFLANKKASDIRSTINDSGLSCPSSHFNYGELTEKLDESIEFAQALGLKHMICSAFRVPKTAALNDYLVAADKLNIAAEKIKKAGMQAGFHNHSIEFVQLDGELIYDALMKRLDPQLVKMQFQTEVINLGFKASDYFKKYPGRFISAHLSDWTADKKQMPVGQGVIEWKEFFAAAKTGGVETFFVEMDMDKYKDSAAYVKALQV